MIDSRQLKCNLVRNSTIPYRSVALLHGNAPLSLQGRSHLLRFVSRLKSIIVAFGISCVFSVSLSKDRWNPQQAQSGSGFRMGSYTIYLTTDFNQFVDRLIDARSLLVLR